MIHRPDEFGEDLKLEADVAVVGSGAGGGPLAKELAEAGYRVVVLEEGGHFTREDFNFKPGEAFLRMYRDAGQTVTLGLPVILLPQGCTVGGTTTVNSGTCLRIPRTVLRHWQVEYGLKDLAPEELDLLYAALEEYLFVKRADPEVVGKNALIFKEAAERLGYSAGFLPRNAKDCEGFGMCPYGCPTNSKQSVNVSFIPDAVRAGAEVYTRCRVTHILTRGNRAVGVKGYLYDPATRRRTHSVEVRSSVVALCGGALQTPSLLFHNRLCLANGAVGRNLYIHPCGSTLALLDEELGNPKGIPQSTYVDEFSSEGIELEGATLPPSVFAITLPWSGKKHSEIMSMYPHFGTFGSMISEHDSWGRVLPGPSARQPLVTYRLGTQDAQRMKLSILLMAEIWFEAGARLVITPIQGFLELRSARDLVALARARIKPHQFIGLSAYHPMGSCPMGGDPENSVVRPTGETWEVENLFICDASVLPTSLGVNPQLTIMALSVRAAGFIDEKLSRKDERIEVLSRLEKWRDRLRREKERLAHRLNSIMRPEESETHQEASPPSEGE
ncbi:MAG: GMC family oxidoreductase [Candidatus Geothermincolales bacterium]